ncbi:hypothetical protein MKW92_042351 [Papaver armeniacum]|nr:hypothetical protein MKW92_042351 [Papaver armeniacum]
MGKPLFYEIWEKPATSCIIGICAIWFYIQKEKHWVFTWHHWRIITSAFSHISVIHLVFNMSALWSLGVVESLDLMGMGVEFYLHYTLVLVVLSGGLVLGTYNVLIQKFKLEYFRRVTAVGYSCVVFGNLFGVLSLPISFAPFESLDIFISIMVPQASFLGHLSGLLSGTLMDGNLALLIFEFIEIEPVAGFFRFLLWVLCSREMGRISAKMGAAPLAGSELV